MVIIHLEIEKGRYIDTGERIVDIAKYIGFYTRNQAHFI